MKRAVFIDKDGTLIQDVPYNIDPSLIILNRGALEFLQLLSEAGYLIILVSNQPGVAKGMFSPADISVVNDELKRITCSMVSSFHYCFHGEWENCSCRKPKPGLILDAAREQGICLTGSWMIGDILNDVEAGNRAGTRSLLLDTGGETEWIVNRHRVPFSICTNLVCAARVILNPSYHTHRHSS